MIGYYEVNVKIAEVVVYLNMVGQEGNAKIVEVVVYASMVGYEGHVKIAKVVLSLQYLH